MNITNYFKRIFGIISKFIIYHYHKVILEYSQMKFTKKIALTVLLFTSAMYFTPQRLSDGFPMKNKCIDYLLKYLSTLQEKYVTDEPLPAERLKHLKPKHPVIIIPGISSTTLELWQGSNKHFRTNVWGKFDMLIQLLTDVNTWADLISLDSETGLDKPSCKVRPANGLSSSDYILPMYWVWQKMLNNFGIIGYDHLNLHVSTYDWRLSCENLEIRDKYFSKLKLEIEMYYKLNNEKIILLTHSLGSIITLHFFTWVESIEEGFVEKYIHTFISIAAPFLGVSKSVSGLLSGESRSTVSSFEGALCDILIRPETRKQVFQSWGSIKTLLPKGGAKIWGSGFIVNIDGMHIGVDELIQLLHTENDYDKSLFRRVHRAKKKKYVRKNTVKNNLAFEKKIYNLKVRTRFLHECLVGLKYKNSGYQIEKDAIIENLTKNVSKIIRLYKNNKNRTKLQKQNFENWVDPTKNKLPNAPSLKIYSCYGVGLPTERGYYYTFTKEGKLKINTKVKASNVVSGIKLCDGDGTVPTFSLGYMGFRGWKNRVLNPSDIKTYVREYGHEATYMKGIRGGPNTSEHVDILGNYNLTSDILRICCGENVDIEDKIHSSIKDLCDEIDA